MFNNQFNNQLDLQAIQAITLETARAEKEFRPVTFITPGNWTPGTGMQLGSYSLFPSHVISNLEVRRKLACWDK